MMACLKCVTVGDSRTQHQTLDLIIINLFTLEYAFHKPTQYTLGFSAEIISKSTWKFGYGLAWDSVLKMMAIQYDIALLDNFQWTHAYE